MSLRRKIVIGVFGLISVVLAAIAIRFPSLETRLAAEIERGIGERVGGTTTLTGLKISHLNEVTLDSIAFERSGASVSCSGIKVRLSPVSTVFGHPSASSVDVSECVGTYAESGSAGATDADATGRRPSDLPDPAELLRKLSERVGVVRIRRIDATATVFGLVQQSTLSEVTFDASNDSRVLHGTADLRGTAQHEASPFELALLSGGGIRATWSGSTVFALGGSSEAPAAAMQPAQAEVPGAAAPATESGLSGNFSFSGVELTQTSIKLQDLAVVVDHRSFQAAAVLGVIELANTEAGRVLRVGPGRLERAEWKIAPVTETAPPPRRRRTPTEADAPFDRDLPPPVVAPALDRLMVEAAEFFHRARSVVRLPRPGFRIEASALTLADLRGAPLEISSFSFDPDGSVDGVLSYRGIGVVLDLQDDIAAEQRLTIENVRLEPLAPWLGEGGTLAAGLSLSAVGKINPDNSEIDLSVDVAITDASLGKPAIAAAPLTGMSASASVRTRALFAPQLDVQIVGEGSFSGIPLDFDFRLSGASGSYKTELNGGLRQETTCAAILDAIPDAMLPNLSVAGIQIEGAAAPRFEVEYEFSDPGSYDMEISGMPGTCRIVEIGGDFDPSILNRRSYVHTVTEGVTNGPIRVGPGTDSWVDIESLPSYVPALMYLSEEINFFGNPGLSINLINKGMRLNIERRRYAYGGSTVSQQLVKNLFLRREKSLSRKLEEALIVWAMEERVSKDRILALYLNCIEFGPNIYGIRAAAKYYFDADPSELTPLEAAYIAAIKPNPLVGSHYRSQGYTTLDGWLARRIAEITARLVEYGGHISAEESAYYAPYVVVFPTSPNFATSPYPRLPRPEGAIIRSFTPRATEESAGE